MMLCTPEELIEMLKYIQKFECKLRHEKLLSRKGTLSKSTLPSGASGDYRGVESQ